jgi:hypothetical protein
MLDLEIALNYGQATGAAQLLRFITEHTEVCIGICARLFEGTDISSRLFTTPRILTGNVR